jgi:hypothetical protein
MAAEITHILQVTQHKRGLVMDLMQFSSKLELWPEPGAMYYPCVMPRSWSAAGIALPIPLGMSPRPCYWIG